MRWRVRYRRMIRAASGIMWLMSIIVGSLAASRGDIAFTIVFTGMSIMYCMIFLWLRND
jgi:hypothetical protein